MTKSIVRKDGFLPYVTNGFTFGFEIEGAFNKNILPALKKGGLFKLDGSVCADGNPFKLSERVNCTERNDCPATEYNSPIFNSIDELVEQLRLFSRAEGNYWSNGTCGIHLHIGYKVKNGLRNKFQNKDIIERLQSRFVPLMCKCVKERIEAHQWCSLHENFRDNLVSNHSKYHAVNFHSQGTIELRLFAPCQHLFSDIQKVLTEFFRLGYADYKAEAYPITCMFSKEKIEIVEVVKPCKPSYDYGFNRNRSYVISPLAMIAEFKDYEKIQKELAQDYILQENYGRYKNNQEFLSV